MCEKKSVNSQIFLRLCHISRGFFIVREKLNEVQSRRLINRGISLNLQPFDVDEVRRIRKVFNGSVNCVDRFLHNSSLSAHLDLRRSIIGDHHSRNKLTRNKQKLVSSSDGYYVNIYGEEFLFAQRASVNELISWTVA